MQDLQPFLSLLIQQLSGFLSSRLGSPTREGCENNDLLHSLKRPWLPSHPYLPRLHPQLLFPRFVVTHRIEMQDHLYLTTIRNPIKQRNHPLPHLLYPPCGHPAIPLHRPPLLLGDPPFILRLNLRLRLHLLLLLHPHPLPPQSQQPHHPLHLYLVLYPHLLLS